MVDHETYKNEIATGTIPFNLNVKVDGEWKIRCPNCDKHHAEEKFEWVDTDVYEQDRGYEVQSVTLKCPNCKKNNTYY